MFKRLSAVAAAIALTASALSGPAAAEQKELLNSSYDIARELFSAYNEQFVPYWKEKTGDDLTVRQSHAGCGYLQPGD